MEFKEFIAGIIKQRKNRVPELEQKLKDLRNLKDCLAELNTRAATDAADPEAQKGFAEALKPMQVVLAQMPDRFDKMEKQLADAIKRFNKDTINIGVAGTMRQGKSTLLQSISGLGSSIIPSATGGTVTGTKSIIYHDKIASAEVEYFSKSEFLREKVLPYYVKLGFKQEPRSLDAFALQPLPPNPGGVEGGALYEQLKKVYEALPEFKHRLGSSPQNIPIDEVPKFVSQQCGTTYLAVKCVHIRTPFPNGDVTGLGLVDLPGLGEIALGFEEKLVESLQHEVDMIILIRKPEQHGGQWNAKDIDVFSLIEKERSDIALCDWLFVVLNETKDNKETLELMLKNKPEVIADLKMLRANAIDKTAVDVKVFKPALEYLEKNLARIDGAITELFTAKARAVLQELQPAFASFSNILKNNLGDQADHDVFLERFKLFMEKLRCDMQGLCKDWRIRCAESDKAREFEQAVKQICLEADQHARIPTVEDLETMESQKGGWPGALQDALHTLRVDLTTKLCELNIVLHDIHTKTLQELLERIIPAELKNVVPKNDADDARAVLSNFRDMIKDQAPHICDAISFLLQFKYDYLSHFHYRVRSEMALLDPGSPAKPVEQLRKDAETALEYQNGLKLYYDKAVCDVRARLSENDLKNDPNQAMFALVEEIKDRVARTQDIETEWDHILFSRRAEIWPDRFQKLAAGSQRMKEWQCSTQEAISLASAIARRFNH